MDLAPTYPDIQSAATASSVPRPLYQSAIYGPFPIPNLHRVARHGTLTAMIVGFRHKGLERLYRSGSAGGVNAAHVPKLNRILAALDAAASPAELNHPGYGLHALKGKLSGHWAIRVTGNWRVTFCFAGTDVDQVDYCDYH